MTPYTDPHDLQPWEQHYAREYTDREDQPRPDAWLKLRSMLHEAPARRPLRRERSLLRVLAVAVSLLFFLAAGWYLWEKDIPTEAYTATLVDLGDGNGAYYADYLQAAHNLSGYSPVSEGAAGGQLFAFPPAPPLDSDSLGEM